MAGDELTRGSDHATLAGSPHSAGTGESSQANEGTLAIGTAVGRYVVISRLGVGGMGVVYGAHDPDLDRKIALKLLRAQSLGDSQTSEGHRRLLREAQALAKVSHRNVCAVHDVGEWRGLVYVAMELVEGPTLREWMRKTRSWREVLAVFCAAGEGLAAAHERGLVHRDFKPDNVMIGADGVVRVMDFGLARAAVVGPELGAPALPIASPSDTANRVFAVDLTQAGSVLGTPAYMSPEQHAGLAVDAASDQFSLSVALYEALYGQRPFAGTGRAALAVNVLEGNVRAVPRRGGVPRWLHRAVRRGLEADPKARHPSMRAMLDALERGQRAARRTILITGALAIAVISGAGVAWRRTEHDAQVRACQAEGRAIEAAWNEDTRTKLEDAILATGLPFASTTVARVVPMLTEYAASWTESRVAACIAEEVDRSLEPALGERGRWCLEERHNEFVALVHELGAGGSDGARKASGAVSNLTPPAICVDEEVLRRSPAPPPATLRYLASGVRKALSRARALLATGRAEAAHSAAEEAATLMARLDWPALAAEVDHVRGSTLAAQGSYPQAVEALRAAYRRAAQADAWTTASISAIELSHVVGIDLARSDEGRLWALNAEIALARAPDPLRVLEAKWRNNLGLIDHDDDRFDEARVNFEASITALTETLGAEHPELATPILNLAGLERTLVHLDAALVLHERALAIRRAINGDRHPDVGISKLNLGNLHERRGDYTAAIKALQEAYEILVDALGPDHPHVVLCQTNIAAMHYNQGNYELALQLGRQTLATRERTLPADHPDIATAHNNVGLFLLKLDQLDEAQRSLENALEIREAAFGSDHTSVAYALNNLGLVYARRGRDDLAVDAYRRALAIETKAMGEDHVNLAFHHNNLALSLSRLGALSEAESHARRALALRQVGLEAKHPEVASSLMTLGNVLLERGRPHDARALLEQSVAIYAEIDGIQESEPVAWFRLAKAVLAGGGSVDEARVLAERSREGYLTLGGGVAAELAEIDKWLADHATTTRKRR